MFLYSHIVRLHIALAQHATYYTKIMTIHVFGGLYLTERRKRHQDDFTPTSLDFKEHWHSTQSMMIHLVGILVLDRKNPHSD